MNESGELCCGFGEGAGFQNLGTDVRLNAPDFQMRQIGGNLINFRSPVDADAEFIFAFAG